MTREALLLAFLAAMSACGGAETSTGVDAGSGSGGAGGSSGCPNDLPASCPSPAPGWAKDVAPVIAARCATCHVAGGVAADKPLTTHAEVFARKSAVLNQVHACKMPQPGAPPLATAERAALQGWLVCGAPDD
jgi:hypothetical protein